MLDADPSRQTVCPYSSLPLFYLIQLPKNPILTFNRLIPHDLSQVLTAVIHNSHHNIFDNKNQSTLL
ncbi:MAG: hypothetical protein AB2615_04460, partial [Candidatus Thiodiazotropha sp.]